MKRIRQQTAAESAEGTRLVRSRETGKLYRVLREYRHTLLVTPAWKKSGIPFTLPKEAFAI